MQLRLSLAILSLFAAAATAEDIRWVNDCTTEASRGIDENLPVGTVVCRVSATFRNSSDGVTYSVPSRGSFGINATTGVISIARSDIDREASSQVTVSLVAEHSGTTGATSTIALKFNVLDVNDNPPRFIRLPYSASVAENDPIGTVFFRSIAAVDVDTTGDNAEIDISCLPPGPNTTECSIFRVNSIRIDRGNYSATLQLQGAIDYETSTFYSLTLLAADRGSPQRLNQTVNVIVNIIDAQDTGPRFREDFIRFGLAENSTAVVTVGTIEARDGDGGDGLGRPVVIEIESDPLGIFEMAATQNPLPGSVYYRADLRLKTGMTIDREASHGGFYRFNVTATELFASNRTKTNWTRTVNVEIIISDINDNQPQFVNGPIYNVTVAESLVNRSVVPGFDILVKDADGTSNNNKMAISVISSTFPGTFSVNPSSIVGEGSCNLLVADSSKLDYEEPSYRSHTVVMRLQEVGTSEAYATTATVYIELSDINDHSPVFAGNSSLVQIEVSEARPVGWILSSSIRATDKDSGAFGTVTYSLTGADADKMAINSTSGQLTVAKPLDFERQRELSATVRATDGGGLSAALIVYVKVMNYNDKAPFFSLDRYTATIREQSTVLIPPLILRTNDSDSKAPIKFSIISGNTADNAFRIINQNFSNLNGELLINRVGGFNFSDTPSTTFGRFVLRVLAEDDGTPPLNSTCIVEISLQDINNNAPIFNPRNYSASIPETASQGLIVATVTATDADVDTETNKRIAYQLQEGSTDKFTINSLTGEVTVASTNSFDINAEGSTYFLQVVARDGGSPVLSDVASVYVTVTDANNKLPVFSQSLYIFQIGEDIADGSVVGSISATDVDSTANLEFSFNTDSIVARNPFSLRVTSRAEFDYVTALRISSNGTIYTQMAMNRDVVAEIQVMAVVTDRNAEIPSVQTATTTVVVQISQKSIRRPVFSAPWTAANPQILVPLPEGLPAGSTVTTLVASDPATKEKVTKFRIIPGSDGESAFNLDETSGTLTLTKVLDYENRLTTRLSVIVEATSPSNATALCTVIVVIQDKNDNAPVFLSSEYSFTVSEETRYPQEFGMVVARDADSGDFGTVRYSLHGTGSELFSLDSQLGTLKPAPSVILDREAKTQFDFLVRATDSPGASSAAAQRYTDVPLRITLTDSNDNAPTFTNPNFEVSIFENIPASSVILTFTASDPDLGANARVTFAIVSGNTLGYFGVNPTSGDLRVLISLTGKSGAYAIMVAASDGGSPRRTTLKAVSITVRSVFETRGNPVVTFPAEGGSYETLEEAPIGSRILQATARDPDSTDGNLTFSLRGQDASKFSIDASTGWLSNVARLDRETQQSFSIIVNVRDAAGLEALKPVEFRITLIDINDNAPSFIGCRAQYANQPVSVVVAENEVKDINTFFACDPDGSPYNQVQYSITCGNDDGRFAIGSTSGVLRIAKAADRETKSEFLICLLANGTQMLNGSVASNSSELHVKVVIQDADDNGPTFATAGQTVFVESDADFDTRVAEMAANDPDLAENWHHTYSVQSLTYTSGTGSGGAVEKPGAFMVEATTGTVRTRLVNYRPYIGGAFQIVLRVTDTRSRQSTSTLTVGVLGDENRLRFVVSKTPVEALTISSEMLTNISAIADVSLTFQKVAHHVTTLSGSDRSRADVCFAARGTDLRILSLTEARALLSRGSSVQLDSAYASFRIVSLGYCNTYGLYKTYDYLGIEGYWWLFMAMGGGIVALAVGLVAFVILLYQRYEAMCNTLQYQ